LGTVSGSFDINPAAVDLNGDKLADLGAQPSAPNAINVVVNTTQGFWLGVPSSLGPLRAGGSANGTISVNSQNGFSKAVSLACSASHPTVHCSLSPSSVTPGTGSALTVTTLGNSATLSLPASRLRPGWFYAVCFPLGAMVFSGIRLRNRRGRRGLGLDFLGCVLLAGVFFQAACGGGGRKPPGGTPAGNYTIVITGSSGTTQHSTTVSLTVQ